MGGFAMTAIRNTVQLDLYCFDFGRFKNPEIGNQEQIGEHDTPVNHGTSLHYGSVPGCQLITLHSPAPTF